MEYPTANLLANSPLFHNLLNSYDIYSLSLLARLLLNSSRMGRNAAFNKAARSEMPSSKVILYARLMEGAGEKLLHIIQRIAPAQDTEIYDSIDQFSQRLRQPTGELTVAVIIANSKEDLLNLLFIRNLLQDIRIILVLPDREKDTIEQGHRLYPRFVSYLDSNLEEVAAVLNNVLMG